ncbi:hypothetical protein ACHQM5_018397 [Ranunculus cassubicifolius]
MAKVSFILITFMLIFLVVVAKAEMCRKIWMMGCSSFDARCKEKCQGTYGPSAKYDCITVVYGMSQCYCNYPC